MPKTLNVYMGSTKIPAEKTASEVSSLLASYGATKIMIDYQDKQAVALTFAVVISDRIVPFKLPINADALFKTMQKSRPIRSRESREAEDRAQALRVAWRQILRWIQSQFALIDTGMVQMQEVFLPYLTNPSGKTLFEQVAADGFKQLTYDQEVRQS